MQRKLLEKAEKHYLHIVVNEQYQELTFHSIHTISSGKGKNRVEINNEDIQMNINTSS